MDVKESSEIKRIGSGKPGPGRPRGMPNKLTMSAKQAFEMAFERLGGVDQLTRWGASSPTEFYRLYARLVPVQLKAHQEPITINILGSSSEILRHRQEQAAGRILEHESSGES